ncbi:response regulator [Thermodesulfobacterium hveragerdense]|uniref:response regulator n=1 Tax=Thermodesulfobacterium hveragerdense TaxID=53424 RepID=UPI000570D54D|nr:response regulator [Thermodesulfobacterium hveragerdense]
MKTILIISKLTKNVELMADFLQKQGYNTIKAYSYKDLDKILIDPHFDIAFLDIAGYDKNIWDYCKKLKLLNKPFYVLSSCNNPKIKEESLTRGAKGVIVKPIVIKEFLAIIQSLLR